MNRRPKHGAALLLTLVPILFFLGTCGRLARRTITPWELREHVDYLAGDQLAGRETGTEGIALAEEYIRRDFARAGLQPVPGDTDAFLDFTLWRQSHDLQRTRMTVRRGTAARQAEPGVDFRPFWFSEVGEVTAPLVFAGYGITAPEHEWDDYEGQDATGKIVLVLRHEPGNRDPQSPFDGTEYSRHAYFVTKAHNAVRHGAVGMILFTDPDYAAAGSDDLRLGGSLSLTAGVGTGGSSETIPLIAAHASRALARELTAETGYSLEALQRALDDGTRPREVMLGDISVTLGVGAYGVVTEVPARNVAGFLRGGDPDLADEWIVIGAHHDHLGSILGGEGDLVYNGADDNASGTSGVLELAEYFAGRRNPPRRSLLFLTFSGEEAGLLGSEALFANRLIDTGKIRFMVNLDMIGRNADRPVRINGAGFGLPLREIVEQTADAAGLSYRYAGLGEVPANSDYGPFFDAGIPYLSFFTGEHEDYHQLTDHADRLDYGRMSGILQVAAGVIDGLDALGSLKAD